MVLAKKDDIHNGCFRLRIATLKVFVFHIVHTHDDIEVGKHTPGNFVRGVWIRWTGTVEWNGGMDYWNGILECPTPIALLIPRFSSLVYAANLEIGL